MGGKESLTGLIEDKHPLTHDAISPQWELNPFNSSDCGHFDIIGIKKNKIRE